jgi:hypothetical protein
MINKKKGMSCWEKLYIVLMLPDDKKIPAYRSMKGSKAISGKI